MARVRSTQLNTAQRDCIAVALLTIAYSSSICVITISSHYWGISGDSNHSASEHLQWRQWSTSGGTASQLTSHWNTYSMCESKSKFQSSLHLNIMKTYSIGSDWSSMRSNSTDEHWHWLWHWLWLWHYNCGTVKLRLCSQLPIASIHQSMPVYADLAFTAN